MYRLRRTQKPASRLPTADALSEKLINATDATSFASGGVDPTCSAAAGYINGRRIFLIQPNRPGIVPPFLIPLSCFFVFCFLVGVGLLENLSLPPPPPATTIRIACVSTPNSIRQSFSDASDDLVRRASKANALGTAMDYAPGTARSATDLEIFTRFGCVKALNSESPFRWFLEMRRV
ncbi:hypothetical protein NL676_028676 [Syzygium grande]|nr:hypothetical protein NL676_028676 [Syzygium grande]